MRALRAVAHLLLVAVILGAVALAFELVFAAEGRAAPLSEPSTFELHPPANWSPTFTRHVEEQIQSQVATEMVSHWPVGLPWITTRNIPDAIQITFMPVRVLARPRNCGVGAWGCHGQNAAGQPEIWVALIDRQDEAWVVDHEILETLVNPYAKTDPTMIDGQMAEVCDPVEASIYRAGGVELDSFVYPNYFTSAGVSSDDSFTPVAPGSNP